jgi:hypothetical protein
VHTSEDKSLWGLVYDPRGLLGVTTARPGVAGVLWTHYFSCSSGAAKQKTHRDTLRGTCVFAYGGIRGSRSAFRCIRGVQR